MGKQVGEQPDMRTRVALKRDNADLRKRVAELEGALEAARDTHTISCSECDASFTVYTDEPSLDLSAMEFGWRFRSDEGWTCPEHGSWPPTARPDTEEPDDREYGDFDDVDDPLAFAVLSMERALEELDKPKRYEVGCLQQAIGVCKRAMNRPEHDV